MDTIEANGEMECNGQMIPATTTPDAGFKRLLKDMQDDITMIRAKCAPMRSPMAEKHRIPDHVTEKELLKDKKILRTGMILRRPVPNVKYTFTPSSESSSESPSPPPVKKEKKYRYTSSSESPSPLWAKKERRHLETSEKKASEKHTIGEDHTTRRRKKHRRSGVPPGALEDENFTFTSSGRLICAPGKHPNFSK